MIGNMTTGELIRARRNKQCMTQKQLANACGMADSAIRKYESGRITPKVKTLEKIANALNCKISDLIPGAKFSTQESRREIERKHGLVIGTLETERQANSDAIKENEKTENQDDALFWSYVLGRFASYAEINRLASNEETSQDFKLLPERTRESVTRLGEKWNIPFSIQEDLISTCERSYRCVGGGIENIVEQLLLLSDEQLKVISELVNHLSRKTC